MNALWVAQMKPRDSSSPDTQMARALDDWANARERAISELLTETQISGKTATSSLEAARLRSAIGHLSTRMREERARAREIRLRVAARSFSRISSH